MKRYENYIDREWSPPRQGAYLPSLNPATGAVNYEFARSDADDVDRAVRAARRAFESDEWRAIGPAKRGRLLGAFAAGLRDAAEELAVLETLDNGKLIREMRGQHQMIPDFWQYFAGWPDKIRGTTVPMESRNTLNIVEREPIGVVGVIVPWNSPLLLTTYKIAPALAAGNTVVIKPSEHTSASILRCMEIMLQAGFPAGVVNVVTGLGDEVGDPLVAHPDVDLVSFTGGGGTARKIASRAAERPMRTLMELGGKSPNIVFRDADLDAASAGVVAGIFAAAGQTCIAGSRCLVDRVVYDELVAAVMDRTSKIRMGDPLAETTDVGPVAFEAHMESILAHVEMARESGASVLRGGRRSTDPDLSAGYYVEPTVLDRVTSEMPIAQNEVFGPVLSLLPFRDEDEAVRIANDSRFALAAGVWTQNLGTAHRVARALRAGTVWVNTYRMQAPQSPVGGFKESGWGKELGEESIYEYTQQKSVWVNLDPKSVKDPFTMNAK